MKLRNIYFVTLLIAFGLFTFQSCTKSELPVNVKYTAAQPTSILPVVRADGTVFFTGNTIDLKWAAETKGGQSVWDLYYGASKSPALLEKGLSATTKSVTVEDGVTYYWKVVTTDAQGITTTSDTYHFTAINGSNPKMTVNLKCETDVLSAIGVDLAADDVVDLRLLILKKSDLSVVDIIDDGSSAEVYRGFLGLPDGDYVLGVDIYSTIYAGDLNSPITLSLSLQFAQTGMIDNKLEYTNIMTNENPCSKYRTYLATVKKVGSQYTVDREVSYMEPSTITYQGTDATDWPSEVTSIEDCTKKTMTGLGFGWMHDWWGETIVSGGTLTYTVSGNTLTIPLQKYCKTTYGGKVQPEYSISGTGTLDNTGAYPVWTIHYDFIQSGQSIATVSMDYGWPTPYFEAILTTNPAGL